MTRVAGIDCGTNSIRLLIADVDGATLVDVVRETRAVRLGQGVDRTGRLASEALRRTRVALANYAATIRANDVERVRMVATSATRDASNRAAFVALVNAELGVDPEVITGAEEAALSFAGAASVLSSIEGPLLVADIGGGSTEVVRGRRGGELQAHSMDVGCVRMTERHLRDDPPTPAQIEAVVDEVREAIDLAGADVALDPGATFIGVAGTVTTIAGIALGLSAYDASEIHGTRIRAAEVRDVTARLLAMSHAQRAALPVMHPGRVDVICGGALILRTLLEEVGAESMIASEHDILDGIALRLA